MKKKTRAVTVTAGGGTVTVNGKKYKGNSVAYHDGNVYVDGSKVCSRDPQAQPMFQWMSVEPRKKEEVAAETPVLVKKWQLVQFLDLLFVLLLILPCVGLMILLCKGILKSIFAE
jgi:hypothetical protein